MVLVRKGATGPAGVCALCPCALLLSIMGETMKKYNFRVAINRARELRAMGLSVAAISRSTGMGFGETFNACDGMQPAVTLPDLPGVGAPVAVAPSIHHTAAYRAVEADIRRDVCRMRYVEFMSYPEIAAKTTLSVSAVVKYAKMVIV